MATRIQWHVGEVSPRELAEAVSSRFEGATITGGIGIWEGEKEPQATLEVIDPLDSWEEEAWAGTPPDTPLRAGQEVSKYLEGRFGQELVAYTIDIVETNL